jgi:hypothetical protein
MEWFRFEEEEKVKEKAGKLQSLFHYLIYIILFIIWAPVFIAVFTVLVSLIL